MPPTHPNVVVISGPNGSGKSTAAPALLRDYLGIGEFVNADVIAQGLSAFASENVALQAGRIMLDRLRELALSGVDFAFETTLASRSFAPWLGELKQSGYQAHLLFLWLPSAEMAIARVASRVQRGGHHVPDDVIRRRYAAGLKNFFGLYLPIVDSWRLFDNSGSEGYELIAQESGGTSLHIENPIVWQSIVEKYQ
jgi:predicted ABC-type ATPase